MGVWAATLGTPVSFYQNTTLTPPPEVTPPKAIFGFSEVYYQACRGRAGDRRMGGECQWGVPGGTGMAATLPGTPVVVLVPADSPRLVAADISSVPTAQRAQARLGDIGWLLTAAGPIVRVVCRPHGYGRLASPPAKLVAGFRAPNLSHVSTALQRLANGTVTTFPRVATRLIVGCGNAPQCW